MALRVELDWAGDEPAELGTWAPEGEPTSVVVVEGQEKGPAGWPTVVVWAAGSESSVAGPRLIEWLVAVYNEDSDGASELADLAEWVPSPLDAL